MKKIEGEMVIKGEREGGREGGRCIEGKDDLLEEKDESRESERGKKEKIEV